MSRRPSRTSAPTQHASKVKMSVPAVWFTLPDFSHSQHEQTCEARSRNARFPYRCVRSSSHRKRSLRLYLTQRADSRTNGGPPPRTRQFLIACTVTPSMGAATCSGSISPPLASSARSGCSAIFHSFVSTNSRWLCAVDLSVLSHPGLVAGSLRQKCQYVNTALYGYVALAHHENSKYIMTTSYILFFYCYTCSSDGGPTCTHDCPAAPWRSRGVLFLSSQVGETKSKYWVHRAMRRRSFLDSLG